MKCSTWSIALLLFILPAVPPCIVAQEAALHGQWLAVSGVSYGVPVPAASLPLLRFTFDGTEARWTMPGAPKRFRYTAYGTGTPDSLDFYLPTEGPRVWLVPVRSRLRADTLDLAFPNTEPYDPARGAPPVRPKGFGSSTTMEFTILSLVRRSDHPPVAALPQEEARVAAAISADSIERRTRTLAAPGMQGRGSGQRGGERAARTIAGWFRAARIDPLGDSGFLQRVPLFAGRASPSSSLTVGATTFHIGNDFSIVSLSMQTRPAKRQTVTSDVVLFGPSLGEKHADLPLPDIDVRGKIVAWVALSGPDDGSRADLFRTYEALQRSGAAAIILTTPRPLPEALLHSPTFGGLYTLDADLYGARRGCPMILLGPKAFGALFGDGADVRAFMSGFGAGKAAVQPTGKTVTISYGIEQLPVAPSFNVAGVIRGADPALRNEAIVYTAHYDAYGTLDGVVYPGAADNALGVAELIEVARAIRETGVRPRRSIVFLATAGEERGLLGSAFWTRHPTWPLHRIAANINLDGGDSEAWGPLDGTIDLTRQTTLGDVAADVSAALGIPLLPNDGPGDPGSSSDFYEFLRSGIPAIQLYGIGGDPAHSPERAQRWSRQRLHQPGDAIDAGWDWAGPRQMAQLYLLLGLRVANAEAPPVFRK